MELAIGTAVLLIQPGDEVEPIRYTAYLHFRFPMMKDQGSVEKIYRKLKRPYEVLDQESPDIKIPQEMVKRYENDPTEEVEMIEGTYYDKQSGNIHYQIIDYQASMSLFIES